MKKKRLLLIVIIALVFGIILVLFFSEQRTNTIDTMIDGDSKETASKDSEPTDKETDNKNGLDIVDKPDESVDSVDGSGVWDGRKDSKEDKNHTESNKESEKNILVDDKVWGDVK